MSLVQSAPTVAIVLPADATTLKSKPIPEWTIPASAWEALCHPNVDEVSQQVDAYFLEHWPFPNAKAERTFIGAGFSRVTSLYFPLAKDDRIHFACRLLTVLFLIDGLYDPLRTLCIELIEIQMFSKTCPSRMERPTMPSSCPSQEVTFNPIVSTRNSSLRISREFMLTNKKDQNQSSTSSTIFGKVCEITTKLLPTMFSSPHSLL
jgi:hypothetical protein